MFDATPLVSSVKFATVVPTPQPVEPYNVTCHEPARSGIEIFPKLDLSIPTPSRKLPGLTPATSTRLNLARSGATWIVKFQPQAVPHVRFAVPDPLVFKLLMVKVCPVRAESPQLPCEVSVPVPDPDEFMVISASMSANPQPVVPRRAMSQFPARSDVTILPVLAEHGIASVAANRTASHSDRNSKQWFFIAFSFD